MTNYEPITFGKLSEAIAYLEDGGKLYQSRNGRKMPVCITEVAESWPIYDMLTEVKPAPWYEKLDGTVENGVLCRIESGDEALTALIARLDGGHYVDEVGGYWSNATPLTRAEIQRFMDNAPEEV